MSSGSDSAESTPLVTDATRSGIRLALLAWFHENKRDLPWRGSQDPYAVWVSEIMLQQTQVATVIEYFNRWMTHFPTIQDLAASELDTVMELWAGLGYYRRARLLHRAATGLVNEADGVMPTTRDTLLDLPGIGRYTAGAIASIVYDEPVAVVDGNVKRVLARLFVVDGDPSGSKNIKKFWSLAEELVDPNAPGDFNEAVMELGATVCKPRSPNCDECPLNWTCEAFAVGGQLAYPEPKKRKPPRVQTTFVGVAINDEGHYWMTRASNSGLLGGLWGFNGFESEEQMADHLLGRAVSHRGDVRHLFTHIDMTYAVYVATVADWVEPQGHARWVDPQEMDELPVSVAMKKVASLLSD